MTSGVLDLVSRRVRRSIDPTISWTGANRDWKLKPGTKSRSSASRGGSGIALWRPVGDWTASSARACNISKIITRYNRIHPPTTFTDRYNSVQHFPWLLPAAIGYYPDRDSFLLYPATSNIAVCKQTSAQSPLVAPGQMQLGWG